MREGQEEDKKEEVLNIKVALFHNTKSHLFGSLKRTGPKARDQDWVLRSLPCGFGGRKSHDLSINPGLMISYDVIALSGFAL